jgi:hypothetical protein
VYDIILKAATLCVTTFVQVKERQKVWVAILGHVFEYLLLRLQGDFCFRLIMSAFENKLLQRKFRAYGLFNDAFNIDDSMISEW